MPVNKELKKVMVIGSGPIVIGQAAEFDYAGTQACLALKEEGINVVLVNSNPATIMTDTNIADKVYMEPLTPGFIKRIIRKEKPDGLLPTLGGQVGLNLAVELAEEGFLDKENVKLLGTKVDSIKKAEDRDLFKKMLEEINEPIAESKIVSTIEEAEKFSEKIGFPLIVRPAYTLGGTGGGIANNIEDLRRITQSGLKYSRINQALIEKCVSGWKEIEFEVMRDSKDTCVAICSMENVDPVGVHTGDSIVVAPSQTLSNREYQLLRGASLKIIRALGVEGGCNIQFALDTDSMEYYVIEVNPRVSRSSALASKATGYPIARIAAKIAVGLDLDEIENPITGATTAAFEPVIDYIVMKIPRWPFDKFAFGDRSLGTQMKATGEIMAIDRTFEGALMKGIRSLELDREGLTDVDYSSLNDSQVIEKIKKSDDERIYYIAEAFLRGITIEEINKITLMDIFFLTKIKNIIDIEKQIKEKTIETLDKEILRKAKNYNISDKMISLLLNSSEEKVREKRKELDIKPVYKMVDTCGGEFAAKTPYFYSTYEKENEAIPTDKKKVVILGSGPIRIGQGVEFDYCTVHCIWALKEIGIETIVINNNPETVSTDFNTSDRLYFEPLTTEDVMNVIENENPEGVIVQFGGQTAINLMEELHSKGVKIIGTDVENMDMAEDREKFTQLLDKLNIPYPKGKTAQTFEKALEISEEIGFPLLVRPSYVLGGRAMEIIHSKEELEEYVKTNVRVSPKHPILLDKYLLGMEVEVDAICDGKEVLIPGIMEHIERAGVHSGDSIAVYPDKNLTKEIKDEIVKYTKKIALGLNVKGMINIQMVVHEKKVYILEVNPRSSRTVPFMSKVTGLQMVNIATKVALGKTLKEMGLKEGLYPEKPFYSVKTPVFSFAKLVDVETSLGPEMKSTGEGIGIDENYSKALYKAFLAEGTRIPTEGGVLVTIADKDKEEVISISKGFWELGFKIYSTEGTAKILEKEGIEVVKVNKIKEGSHDIPNLIKENSVNIVINTLTKGKEPKRDGFKIRRLAVENGIPCATSLDTAKAMLNILDSITFRLKPM